jgi:hypothetical protein
VTISVFSEEEGIEECPINKENGRGFPLPMLADILDSEVGYEIVDKQNPHRHSQCSQGENSYFFEFHATPE